MKLKLFKIILDATTIHTYITYNKAFFLFVTEDTREIFMREGLESQHLFTMGDYPH